MKLIFSIAAAIVAVAVLTQTGKAGDVEQITSAAIDFAEPPAAVRTERVQVCETDAFGRKSCRWVTVTVPDEQAKSTAPAAEVVKAPASAVGAACPCVAATGSCPCSGVGSAASAVASGIGERLGSFRANRPRLLARAAGAVRGIFGGCR